MVAKVTLIGTQSLLQPSAQVKAAENLYSKGVDHATRKQVDGKGSFRGIL
jgi:hypothetical protein